MNRLIAVCLALLLAAPLAAAADAPMSRDAALAALAGTDAAARRKAALRLAEVGRMEDTPALVASLRDDDEFVRAVSEQSLWAVWSRSGNAKVDLLFKEGVAQMQAGELEKSVETFGRVIRMAPGFAEGWNKRATVYYLLGEYRKSLADCDEVMKRNPYHFGALAGYGQIWFRLDEPEKSLEYFRRALAVNPNMQGVRLSIEGLERLLAERRQKMI